MRNDILLNSKQDYDVPNRLELRLGEEPRPVATPI